ncbi:MAG: hypothetical protein ACI8UR_002024 [Natronomonas sp.]|jgi:uncharacterized protein Yka (UPF0111/DUF47 family)|uniref:DUF47 domain-containing protein n=1 Tax=Natronomonas sp. TaxID=2184060 RepID=UPI003989FF6C
MATPQAVPKTVRGRTETLVTEVGRCVESLLTLIENYRDDEALTSTVNSIRERESACNATARELRVVLGRAVATDSEAYRTVGGLVSFVTSVEAVSNRAEAVAYELATMRPSLSDTCRIALVRMAELAISAFEALDAATTAFLDALMQGTDTGEIVEPIEAVRTLESECDDYRQTALEATFTDGLSVNALALRAVIHDVDAVVDSAEAAADRLDVIRATRL